MASPASRIITPRTGFGALAAAGLVIALAAPLVAQTVSAPAGSGIDTSLMRLQPLDNGAPPGFIGEWEPFDDGDWLSFDLDFTTGTEVVDILEARVRYLDAEGGEIASATVGPRDLAFAILSRTDAGGAVEAFNGTGGRLDDMGNLGSQCIRDLDFDTNGLLVAGGTGTAAPIFPAMGVFPNGSLLARYDTNGSTDDGFDDNGLLAVAIEHPLDEDDSIRHGIRAIATTALDEVWTGGNAWLDNTPSDGEVNSYWSLTRIDVNGDIDFPFGTRIVFPETSGGVVNAIVTDGASRPVAAGSVTQGDLVRAAIATFELGGELSDDFGLRVADFLPEDTFSTYTALAHDSMDRLYAAGVFGPPQELLVEEDDTLEDRSWFVARFLADGTLDTAFGDDGIAVVEFPGIDRATPSALVIDAEDRIVTVGTASEGDGISAQAAFARLLPSGAPDDTFRPLDPGTGLFVTDAGFAGLVSATDVALDGEGRIVASIAAGDVFTAMRLLGDDGSADSSFGDGGVAAHDHPETEDQTGNFVTSVEIASGNRVVLGGCADDGAGERVFALVRLLEDGSLDSNAAQVPGGSRLIIAFPDEALADDERLMPFADDPPTTVEVELDLREVESGDEWTIAWADIQPDVYAPNPLPGGGSYIFPLAPPQVLVALPDDAACAALDEDEEGDDETAPDPPELTYAITASHELRFGSVETHHRHLVQTLDTPSASNDQRHAYDIVVRDEDGRGGALLDAACMPIETSTNASSYMWGQQVVAIADGDIVSFDSSQPNNPSPGAKVSGVPRGGNTITIDHGNGDFSRYSHMQAGSMPGNLATFPCSGSELCSVSQGDVLGLAGNSGNSSGPHLHFVLMDGSDADADEGRIVTFSNIVIDDVLETNLALHSGAVIDDIVAVSMIELNPPSPSGLVDEVEGNDSLEEHQGLTPPTTVQGTIGATETPTLGVRGDRIEDIYRFEVETRSQVLVRLETTTGDTDLDVYLLNDGLQMLNRGRAGWGPTGTEEMVVTVPPGGYFVAVTDPADGSGTGYDLDIDVRPFAWQYAAKTICGIQTEPLDGRLTRGRYATTVNIHNPGGAPALIHKKLALAYPPEEQAPGRILEIGEDELGYDQAVKTDCADIGSNAITDTTLGDATYFEGFTVIESTERLDVSAVYTTAALTPGGDVSGHTSIDVEQIVERGLGVDLSVEKTAEDFVLFIGDRPIHFVLYTVEVANAGPATASDVRVVDEFTLALLGADGLGGLLPAPLDLTPAGELVSLESISATESRAEFAIGDIAAGASRSIRFWAVAVAAPQTTPAFAVATNRASIRAGEAELLEDDNVTLTNTQILP